MKKPWLIYRKSRDVLLTVTAEHVCWRYPQHSTQPSPVVLFSHLPLKMGMNQELNLLIALLAVHRKSRLSGRIRTIYWPSVKIQRQD